MAKKLQDYFPMIRTRKEVLNEISRQQLNTLQEYVLIPLDIFKENTHNKTIENELDAWLTFISFDEPEKIVELIEMYPEFKSMYEELYQFCLNVERVMGMFSKELLELDRNTVQYMIEEQEKELKEISEKLRQKNEKLREKDEKLQEKDEKLLEKDAEIEELKRKLAAFEFEQSVGAKEEK